MVPGAPKAKPLVKTDLVNPATQPVAGFFDLWRGEGIGAGGVRAARGRGGRGETPGNDGDRESSRILVLLGRRGLAGIWPLCYNSLGGIIH